MRAAHQHPRLQPLLVSLFLVSLHSLPCALGAVWGDWISGRATMFSDTWDPWQMSIGHCQYGYLSRKACTGWDVAAVADTNKDYNRATSNCGVCYEVACDPGTLTDGYGQSFDRSDCYNNQYSVVVGVVDLCECNYAPNAYSNRRWCCGDNQHLDLSAFAFEKLYAKIQGVFKTKYRVVSCDHVPESGKDDKGKAMITAPDVPNPTQPNPNEAANEPSQNNDKRPCSTGGGSSTTRRRRPTPKRPPPRRSGGTPRGPAGGNVAVGQWSINAWTGTGPSGKSGARCGTLLPWGGFTFQGGLQSKKVVDFWLKKEGGKIPNLVVYVEGNGRCKKKLHVSRLKQVGWQGDYIRFRINLRTFGCGGVHKAVLQNNIGNWGWQNICIDGVRGA